MAVTQGGPWEGLSGGDRAVGVEPDAGPLDSSFGPMMNGRWGHFAESTARAT